MIFDLNSENKAPLDYAKIVDEIVEEVYEGYGDPPESDSGIRSKQGLRRDLDFYLDGLKKDVWDKLLEKRIQEKFLQEQEKEIQEENDE